MTFFSLLEVLSTMLYCTSATGLCLLAVNTSKHARINLTMKANNAALAQRLQQVKQDLRTVIDENTYLIKENQEFLLGNHQLENQNQEFLLRIHQLENQNHLDQRNNDVDVSLQL